MPTGLEHLDVPVAYARPPEAGLQDKGVVVVPCSDEAGRDLLERGPGTLDWLPFGSVVPQGSKLHLEDQIPVLFWGEGYEDGSHPFATVADGTVVFYADIIASALFMLTRWEETVVEGRDPHGRFLAGASVAYRQGFLDRPVVDEYALVLREWLSVLLPGWKPEVPRFSVKLSHDVDSIRRFAPWYTAVPALGGDLLKRRSLRSAWNTAVSSILFDQDPFFKGMHELARISLEHGLGDDAFFFMAAQPGPDGSCYDFASEQVIDLVRHLQQRGFEIGIHASYGTLNDPEKLALEKVRFDNVLEVAYCGGRQHFLRFQVPHTWRHWEQVGLAYDATMAYADCEGFRCGTCHPYRPYDVELDRELDLWERPLIVMDGSLRDYRGLTPAQGKARILELAARCRQVGGEFSLLWHNSSLSGSWEPWAPVYKQVVAALAEMQGPGRSR
jgi:hypothetical protein